MVAPFLVPPNLLKGELNKANIMADIPYDNDKINNWAAKNLADVKAEGNALGIKHTAKSPSPGPSLTNVTKKVRNCNTSLQS